VSFTRAAIQWRDIHRKRNTDMSRFFSDDGTYVGPSATSAAARDHALKLHQQAMRQQREPRVEYGDNRHHDAYTRIKVDEAA
jgi:hypothetical protein